MPFAAVLKVKVSGKVSSKASHSENNWRASSKGSIWTLYSPYKTFEGP